MYNSYYGVTYTEGVRRFNTHLASQIVINIHKFALEYSPFKLHNSFDEVMLTLWLKLNINDKLSIYRYTTGENVSINCNDSKNVAARIHFFNRKKEMINNALDKSKHAFTIWLLSIMKNKIYMEHYKYYKINYYNKGHSFRSMQKLLKKRYKLMCSINAIDIKTLLSLAEQPPNDDSSVESNYHRWESMNSIPEDLLRYEILSYLTNKIDLKKLKN